MLAEREAGSSGFSFLIQVGMARRVSAAGLAFLPHTFLENHLRGDTMYRKESSATQERVTLDSRDAATPAHLVRVSKTALVGCSPTVYEPSDGTMDSLVWLPTSLPSTLPSKVCPPIE